MLETSPMPALRRLRGTYRETPGEFFSSDGFFLVLLALVAPAVTIWAAVISEFTFPPADHTHWYLLAMFPALAIAIGIFARRAGTSVCVDGTAITIGSRYVSNRSRIAFEDILEARLEKVHLEYSTGTILVIVTASRKHCIFVFSSLQRELPFGTTMRSPQSPSAGATAAIFIVYFACVLFWLCWVPMEIGSRLPEGVKGYFDERPTLTLMALLGGAPFAIVGLAIVAAATSAVLLRPFIAKSTARKLLESIGPPTGLGRVERFLVGLFRDERP